jgi:UPF0755 protein
MPDNGAMSWRSGSGGRGGPRGRLARVGIGAALAVMVGCGTPTSGTARVTIPPGATMRVAADSLARAGVIHFSRAFRVYASLRHGDRAIRAGTYAIPRGSDWATVLTALREGKGMIHVIVIPEGFALAQIVPLVASRLGVPEDSVMAAAQDTALLHRLNIPTPTLEGYLFPDTYTFVDGTTARTAIAAMVTAFERVWKPEWTARLDSIPMSRHDVLTLASIVEREARLPQERPVIAAVYMNRLRKGMLLQADPTVQYALPEHQSRLLYKDLKTVSPYNTYRHLGLPPGPIGSPGRPSIEAALYPSNVPYLYFVAFPDGHHEFRIDLAGHEKAKGLSRHAWDSVAVLHAPDGAGAAAKRGRGNP